MLVNNKNILISKIDQKVNSKNEQYLLVDFLDIESGDSFNVMDKDLNLLSKIKVMNMYDVNLNVSNSKFGMRIEFSAINKALGAIGSQTKQ